MEAVALNGMDKLLPTLEQAKLLGVIKEPEELEAESRNHFTMKGVVIGSIITITLFVAIMSYYKYQDRKSKET